MMKSGPCLMMKSGPGGTCPCGASPQQHQIFVWFSLGTEIPGGPSTVTADTSKVAVEDETSSLGFCVKVSTFGERVEHQESQGQRASSQV